MEQTTLHPLVEKTLREQVVYDAAGKAMPLHSHVPRATCELIYDAAREVNAVTALETGMAYGVATLCLADSVRRNSTNGRLFSIDPSQTTGWNGIALLQAERAGLRDAVQLFEAPAHVALPQILATGARLDLAFIDGWHTFDHALVDFFYIDLMLRTGGMVILDDVGYPAIHAVARFIASNRAYEIWRSVRQERPPRNTMKTNVKRVLRRLGRTDLDPSDEHARELETLRSADVVAFRKVTHDERPFNHFRPF